MHFFVLSSINEALAICVFINILLLMRRKSSKLSQTGRNEKSLRTTGIEGHSRVNEGVIVGSCRINYLRFAGDSVLLGSSEKLVGELLLKVKNMVTQLHRFQTSQHSNNRTIADDIVLLLDTSLVNAS